MGASLRREQFSVGPFAALHKIPRRQKSCEQILNADSCVAHHQILLR